MKRFFLGIFIGLICLLVVAGTKFSALVTIDRLSGPDDVFLVNTGAVSNAKSRAIGGSNLINSVFQYLADDTISSNKLDAATRAMLGGTAASVDASAITNNETRLVRSYGGIAFGNLGQIGSDTIVYGTGSGLVISNAQGGWVKLEDGDLIVSGTFSGSGENLTNIPQSAVTGLGAALSSAGVGGLTVTRTYSTNATAIVVTGAGVASANGVYIRDISNSERPNWTNTATDMLIEETSSDYYIMSFGLSGDIYYTNTPGGGMTGTWYLEEFGVAPAPVVSSGYVTTNYAAFALAGPLHADGSGVSNVPPSGIVGLPSALAGLSNRVAVAAGSGVSVTTNAGLYTVSASGSGSGGGGTNSGPIALSFGAYDTNVALSAVTPVGCVTNAPLFYRLTLSTNALIENPTGGLDGQRITLELIQDATGGRLGFFGDKFAFGSGITGITLSTAASKRDFATFVFNGTADKWYCVGFTRGY